MNNHRQNSTGAAFGHFDLSAVEAFNSHRPTAPPGASQVATMQADAMAMTIYNGPPALNDHHPQQRSYYHAELKFPCDFQGCGRKFRSPHNVQQHVRAAHTGEKPYACGTCAENGKEKAFNRLGSLYRHIRGVHKMDVDFTRGKGVRRVTGRRQNLAPDPAGVYDPQQYHQHQQLVAQTPMHGAEQRAYSGVSYQQQAGTQMMGAPRGLPAQLAGLEGGQVPDANMPRAMPCLYDSCYAYVTVQDVEAHGHAFHGVPHSRDCGCLSCQNIFSNGSMHRHQLPVFQTSATQGRSHGTIPSMTGVVSNHTADQGFDFGMEDFIDYDPAENLSEFLPARDASSYAHEADDLAGDE